MRSGRAHSPRDCLEGPSNIHHQRAVQRRCWNPIPGLVLHFKPRVRGRLQEEGQKLRVLVRADALRLGCASGWGIFDEFEFVLGRVVEEGVESV